MRLLILTQKVDAADDVLGFFHSWIAEFSKRFGKVAVICLEKGAHNLPNNVSVFSLGKEKRTDKYGFEHGFARILYTIRFLRYIIRKRHEYDAVFVHMNPEYVVLGGLLWRLWNKKIGLWYVHRQVNFKLRIAGKLAHIIWSTTPEAFRLKSSKVHFLGHGIDFSHLTSKLWTSDVQSLEVLQHPIRVLHVGRITPIKNLDILIKAAAILKKSCDKKFKVTLVGAPGMQDDVGYEKKLAELVKKLNLKDEVSFAGKVPFARIGELYREADLSVNLTPTGGMDKAVLESIASGTMALSANRAFKELFGEYANYLLYNERDAEDVAKKIMAIMGMETTLKRKIENDLYGRVKNNFSLDTLISAISNQLKEHVT